MKAIHVLLIASGLVCCLSLPAQTEEPKKENPLPVKNNKVQTMAYQLDGRAVGE